ncbi:MAG: glycine zipper 2TM domain-containing protein [Sphingomonas sp.]
MRKIILGLTALAVAIPALPAAAAPQRHGGGYEQDYRGNDGYGRNDRRHSRYDRYYDNGGYYNGPTWRGRDGRYNCYRSDGSTGLILGAAAGALVGRGVDTRGERATGTILGAVLGAVVGKSLDKNNGRRCR